MSVRRLVSVLSVCLIASATAVVAQPKNGKAPVAPAKDPAPSPAPAGSGSDAGSAVQMAEDPPPEDMEGTNENPDAPKTGGEGSAEVKVVAPTVRRSGYPTEEVLRPITLPQNMSEVSIAPHAQISPYAGADALRARYGITRQVQLGLTYLLGGIYDDPRTLTTDKIGFHPGKAVGLDVTVLLQNWIGVRVGVPVYIDPVAVGLQLGAPLKFVLTDKLAIGGMDDFLTLKIAKFAPTFYQEVQNVANAEIARLGTASRGYLKFSAFGVYQHSPKMALIGRFGVITDLGTGGGGAAGASSDSSATSFIRAGFQYSPRRYLDLGLSIGWDDLSVAGAFAPAGYLAVRI